MPLVGHTGLRLLVADDPPYVLDVDSGRRTRVVGLRPLSSAVPTVLPLGGHAVLWVDRG
ncbi:MAG TPA: hypothetical protein VFB26_04820 [Gaiellaceae bacterium]|nr:hypothetical protein [Gaiellaceae bacterium]